MTLDAQNVMNIYHVNGPDAVSDANLQEFTDEVLTEQIARTSSAVTFNNLEIRRVDITGTLGRLYTPTGWPDNGALAGSYLPGPMGVLIKGISLDGIKPGRFRKFLPGVSEAHNDGGILNSSGITNWTNVLNAIQAYQDGAFAFKLVAVTYSGTPPSVGAAWNELNTFTMSSVLAVTRTRKIGTGS